MVERGTATVQLFYDQLNKCTPPAPQQGTQLLHLQSQMCFWRKVIATELHFLLP